jgi:hypothetical protein
MKLEADVITTLRHWFPDLAMDSVHIVNKGPVCWYVRNVQAGTGSFPFIFYGCEHLEPEKS